MRVFEWEKQSKNNKNKLYIPGTTGYCVPYHTHRSQWLSDYNEIHISLIVYVGSY